MQQQRSGPSRLDSTQKSNHLQGRGCPFFLVESRKPPRESTHGTNKWRRTRGASSSMQQQRFGPLGLDSKQKSNHLQGRGSSFFLAESRKPPRQPTHATDKWRQTIGEPTAACINNGLGHRDSIRSKNQSICRAPRGCSFFLAEGRKPPREPTLGTNKWRRTRRASSSNDLSHLDSTPCKKKPSAGQEPPILPRRAQKTSKGTHTRNKQVEAE